MCYFPRMIHNGKLKKKEESLDKNTLNFLAEAFWRGSLTVWFYLFIFFFLPFLLGMRDFEEEMAGLGSWECFLKAGLEISLICITDHVPVKNAAWALNLLDLAGRVGNGATAAEQRRLALLLTAAPALQRARSWAIMNCLFLLDRVKSWRCK